MPFPILFNPLLDLSLIQPRKPNPVYFQRRCRLRMLKSSFRIGRDWREGIPRTSTGIPLSEAGFDFENGVGEEDGLLLEAC